MKTVDSICDKCNIRKVRKMGFHKDGTQRYSNICVKCNHDEYGCGGGYPVRIRKEAPPQPDRCQICQTEERKLVFDHCHETITFRGWICNNCNVGLGFFQHNIPILQEAIKYLTLNTK